MPNRLKKRQEKIQIKRKQTSWRDFVMEICSWDAFAFYKIDGQVSRYPIASRVGKLTHTQPQYNLHIQENISQSNLSFFSNMRDLWLSTPKGYLLTFFGDENCSYSDGVFGANNGYLSFQIGGDVSNVLYSFLIFTNTHDVVSSVSCGEFSQNIFQSVFVSKSSEIFYSKDIHNSHNIWFSKNLVSCSYCLFCSDLSNKKYCIYNKQYTEEEFLKQKNILLQKKELFDSWYDAVGNCKNSAKFCENSTNTYFSTRMKNSNNLLFTVGGQDSSEYMYDCIDAGICSHHFYAVSSAGTYSNHLYCTSQVNYSSNLYYCYHMDNCSYCLGCVGLQNKSYCILNKQYTKEERYEKVDEIFSQMEQEGVLGEFFPASMNPFYFNDTAAYLIDDSFTKEEVTAKGYLRRNEQIKVDIPDGMDVVLTTDLNQYEGYNEQGEREIHSDILKKVIQDEQGNVYRIIPMEYKFLKKHGLPLPRRHWLERLKQNFTLD